MAGDVGGRGAGAKKKYKEQSVSVAARAFCLKRRPGLRALNRPSLHARFVCHCQIRVPDPKPETRTPRPQPLNRPGLHSRIVCHCQTRVPA